MERRLRAFARRAGHDDLDAYLAALRRDVAARGAFLDHMTINVSELFRNPERFAELESRFVPELAARAGGRGLRVWSAGCSYGAEPYALAILLAEAAPRVAHEHRGDGHRPDDPRAGPGGRLQRAGPAARLAASAAALVRRASRTARAQAKPELRAMVRFARLDLLKDPYPRARDLDALPQRRHLLHRRGEGADLRALLRDPAPGRGALRGVDRAGQRRRRARLGAPGHLLLPQPAAPVR